MSNTQVIVEPWVVVDGFEFPGAHDMDFENEANLTSDDVSYPPFMVFDANAQEYLTGFVPTRNAAEKLRSLILRAGAASTTWS